MRVDYHTHHYRCGHARGGLADYVEAALAAGLDEIGLSDHAPYYHVAGDPHPLPATAMSQAELPNYVREMAAVRDRYAGRITVRLGTECDYFPGWDRHYRELWRRFPMDYVIGSVHFLGDWLIFEHQRPVGRTAAELYEEYLRLTQAAARSGAYDVIGHLDCIKTADHLPERAITPLLEETVRVLAETGVAIELNTSGWRKSCNEPFPRAELLACCQHYGVPVTLGSDAHAPEQIAFGFEAAHRLLLDVGYREIATFAARRRVMVPLD
ncbi:MAG TPA: histidinol-phosphatase HisJ family protein [Symbiobacteriaceae bacterium]|jgi:histidinol-phosphatase (PHP family)